ncbi:MAG TPA: anti-sigma factor [Burkholderiales bacterium]|nr:anti-sigma factor [Burkholderiales bacterium]
MNYTNPKIRERLAAEYVLGTMPERARRRFEAQMKLSPVLRALVSEWEVRLTPMATAVPDVTPPRRVWRAIQKRIHGERPNNRAVAWWNNLEFWRATTGLATIALITMGFFLSVAIEPPVTDTNMMVVVMDDTHTNAPAMTVSWEPGRKKQKMLRLRVIGHAEMAPDTAWELWMLPARGQTPVSLGLITTHELQTLPVPPQLGNSIDDAWGLGMTVEPAGGSPAGEPTNPMLYMGECVKT